jgi:glycosyltransferase involved in cell wall biosynthesis
MKAVVATESDVRLQIVGEGPLRARLEQESAALGLKEHVGFLGPLSQTDVATALRKSRALVLPSLSEGMGLVVLEAMSCGLPVVASDVGGIPELVADGETGFLVRPGDEETLAERLLWVLRHREEAVAMGSKGREQVEERFSTRAHADGYRQLFDKAKELLAP